MAASSDKKAPETRPTSEHVKSGRPAHSDNKAPADAGRSSQKSKTCKDDSTIVRQAAAFRLKYRKLTKIRIPVIQIGFHPANGHGQPPSASRCISLLQDIVDIGFDSEEADNNAVCVEAMPGDQSIQQFNRIAIDGDAAMAPIEGGVIQYGSLSHSHLNQILKNLKAGAHAGIESICDSQGRLSLSKLRVKDSGFAAAVDGGLYWEVLHREIQEEAPEALDVIQTALNAKNGLFLLAHEMQALAKLASIVSALAKAGQEVAWASTRERLKKTMPGFADDEHFLDLFRYVIDLGSEEGPFIAGLKAFHCQFVDPKLRKVRLSAFGTMNQLPEQLPHLKIAGIKYMYACDQSHVQMGFCQPISKNTLKTMCNDAGHRALMTMGEDILRFFHVKCAEAIGFKNRQWQIRFYGNLDKELFGEMIAAKVMAATQKSAPTTREIMMGRVAERYYGRLSQSCTSVPERQFTSPAPEQSGPLTVADLQSKIISFDKQGMPTPQQDTVDENRPQEQFKWMEFMQTSSFSEQLAQDQARAVIFSTICSMHAQMQAPGHLDALEVVRTSQAAGSEGIRVMVKVTRDLPAGALMLPSPPL